MFTFISGMTNLQPGITPGILPHSGLMAMNGNAPPPPAMTGGGVAPVGEYGDQTMDLANNKEKTPMCLINELARFNKVRL